MNAKKLWMGWAVAAAVCASAQQQPPPAPPAPPAAPEVRLDLDDFKYAEPLSEAELARLAALGEEIAAEVAALPDLKPLMAWAQQAPTPGAVPKPPAPPLHEWRDEVRWAKELARRDASQEHLYDRGAHHLDRREWERALAAFDAAIKKTGPKTDGAHYWKAYSQSKLGQRDAALATINELQTSFPKSRWLNDARALALEVQQASGQSVSPEAQSDEDLKLIAINALIESDPDRAIPMLDKVLNTHNPPRVKERALFVLAHSRSPKAREIVTQYAKGKGNPDLQAKAIDYLGVYRGGENIPLLSEIYASNQDEDIRDRILRAYFIAKDQNRLLAAAKGESNSNLRHKAVHYLGVLKAQDQLRQLYASETDKNVKREIIRALAISKDPQHLIAVARNEQDPQLKREAVQRLAQMKDPAAAEFLMTILEGK
jgi:HEAT repeat protein